MVGQDKRWERLLRHSYTSLRTRTARKEVGPDFVQHASDYFVHIKSTTRPGPRIGIFLRGSCDLPSMFLTAPLIRATLSGTCCIYKQGHGISDARPDLLLQSLNGVPREKVGHLLASPSVIGELRRGSTTSKIRLPADYFEPALFEPTFEVPGFRRFGPFPKSVVVLSIAPAAVRAVYRHRTDGYLVDPGGFWLNDGIDSALNDLSTAKWFKENFQSLGRMSPELFHQTFGEVIRQVWARTGAHIVVYNALVVEPGKMTHNYQFVRKPPIVRRRELDLALRDLSQELDFHILDIDRILKGVGVETQVDFAHFPTERMTPIADEAYRIFKDLEVI
jgi:hypothetical protein